MHPQRQPLAGTCPIPARRRSTELTPAARAPADRHEPDPDPHRRRVRRERRLDQAGPGHWLPRRRRVLGPRIRRMGSQVRILVLRQPGDASAHRRHVRRWAFNITLFMTGVFALSASGSPNETALVSLVTCWSIGVGGNLPVDSAVFLGMRNSAQVFDGVH